MKDSKDSFSKKYRDKEDFKRKEVNLYKQFYDEAAGVCMGIMLTRQKRLQDEISSRFDKNTLDPEMIKDHALSIVMETVETLDRLPFTFKYWKQFTGEEKKIMMRDLDVAEEVVDILHFVFNIWLCLGYDAADLYAMYSIKNNTNLKRQRDGY